MTDTKSSVAGAVEAKAGGTTTPGNWSAINRDVSFDRRNADWYIDKVVQILVFIGGISAIIFIIGIFIFVTKEGFGFLVGPFDFAEFFGSPRWKPTSEYKTTYGILRWSPEPRA